MQTTHKLFILLVLLTLISACVSEPSFPNEPNISYVSASKTQINQYDSLLLTFYFEDGDGDLGKSLVANSSCSSYCTFEGDSSCYNDLYFDCFLIDSRDSCYAALTLPDLEPTGNFKAISGEVDVAVPPVYCKCGVNPCPSYQDFFYYIVIRDAAGNYSNVVQSETLRILCD